MIKQWVSSLKSLWNEPMWKDVPPPPPAEETQDFVFLQSLRRDKSILRESRVTVPAGAVVLSAIILSILVYAQASLDFVLLVAVMLGLCGLLLFDILSRRRWERDVLDRVTKLSSNHDRLVREVARNRNDIAGLKSGLSRAASTVTQQGRRLSPTMSVEARMIETIVEQLSALGDRPRAEIQSGPDYQILELEMAPPPHLPPVMGELDKALHPDFTHFSDALVLDMIQHAVRHDTVDLFMQPVVTLPQRKPYMFEVYGRVRASAGAYVPAARYMRLAEREHLMPVIDNLLLLRCLQMLRDEASRDKENDPPYILNVSSKTLHDRAFMSDLVTFLSEHRNMARRLVFELSQDDFETMDNGMVSIIEGLSQLGCRFSMDRVRSRRLDINFLKSRHIRFLKLDATWLVRETETRNGFSRIIRFKKQLDAAGIDLIVEKIESEDLLRALLDYNIDLAQGFLLGKPDLAGAWRKRQYA